MESTFFEKIGNNWGDAKNVCLGLDFPVILDDNLFYDFLYGLVYSTRDFVCCYKTNLAFWMKSEQRRKALSVLCECIKEVAPNTPLILDGKFGDVDNTNIYYAEFAFDPSEEDEYSIEVGATTVNPYPGLSALAPFFDREDKGIFVWCSSSNKGSEEFQDDAWLYGPEDIHLSKPLYKQVAREVNGMGLDNVGLVMGATYPERINQVRDVLNVDLPILIPGVGAQGGNLLEVVSAAKMEKNEGFIINSSRQLLMLDSYNLSYMGRVLFHTYYEQVTYRIIELQREIDSVL